MINKFQAGGAATLGSILQEIAKLPQDQLKKIMTAFGKWAQAKGLNIQQLQGNEQALEQAMGQFLQEIQASQAPKARLGAKLNYIRNLKGNAPEGMVVEYYKCGGQTKKRFVKSAGGAKEKDGKKEIANFKKACNGSKMRKACGGFKTKKEDGGELPKDCKGGKARKHQFGGSIIPFYLAGTFKGGIEKPDNTRVSSGRPQVVQNKIPWGAGKGPAGEGPMRLFNDPYVGMGMMAMAPMARIKPNSKLLNEYSAKVNSIEFKPKGLNISSSQIKPEFRTPETIEAISKVAGQPEQLNTASGRPFLVWKNIQQQGWDKLSKYL